MNLPDTSHDPDDDPTLHWLSIVVVAESHNPSILNHDFLVRQEIVPKDWKYVEYINTKQIARLSYSNGLKIEVTPERLQFRFDKTYKNVGHEFAIPWEVSRTAVSYTKTLPHVQYKGIGLNSAISIRHENPVEWIHRRLLGGQSWISEDPPILAYSVDCRIHQADYICRVKVGTAERSMSSGLETEDGKIVKEEAIGFQFNLDHGEPMSVDRIEAIIQSWSDKFRFELDVLRRMRGEEERTDELS